VAKQTAALARAVSAGFLALMVSARAADPIVDEAYRTYYQALAGFDRRDLERELRATVDDALLSGSHVARPSTEEKRRQIADETLTGARALSCSRGVAVSDACIQSTREAADRATVRFNPESIGMVAAVCARMLELGGGCP
jgi:hypothetical protein